MLEIIECRNVSMLWLEVPILIQFVEILVLKTFSTILIKTKLKE